MRLSLSLSRFSFASDGLLWQSIIAVVSALLLILSFPPFELSFLAWVALAPLLKVIAEGVTVRRALWLGWLAGIQFTFFAENWIAHSMTHFGQMLTVIAYAVAMLFAAILAIFPAIFAAIMAKLTRRFGWWAMAFAPAVWVATEWLRPIVTGVTWNALGISQAQHYRIASLAQLGGVYLVSAEIVAVNALIVLTLKFREKSVARAATLLFLMAAIFFLLPPQLRRQSSDGEKVTVVGVQPNLPPDSSVTERDLDNVIRLTKEAIKRAPDKAPDIIIWAESPLALFLRKRRGGSEKTRCAHPGDWKLPDRQHGYTRQRTVFQQRSYHQPALRLTIQFTIWSAAETAAAIRQDSSGPVRGIRALASRAGPFRSGDYRRFHARQ